MKKNTKTPTLLLSFAAATLGSWALASQARADSCEDSDDPTVTIVDPSTNPAELASELLTLTVQATDPGACASGIETISVVVDGQACTSFSLERWGEIDVQHTFEIALPPGTHEIAVQATDYDYGYKGDAALTVIVTGPGDGSYDCGVVAGDGDGDGDDDGSSGGDDYGGSDGDSEEESSGCSLTTRGAKPLAAWILALGGGLLLMRRRQHSGAANASGPAKRGD